MVEPKAEPQEVQPPGSLKHKPWILLPVTLSSSLTDVSLRDFDLQIICSGTEKKNTHHNFTAVTPNILQHFTVLSI